MASLVFLSIFLSIAFAAVIRIDNEHIEKLQNQIIQLKLKNKKLDIKNKKLENKKILDFYMLTDITVTAYSLSINETDKTPNQTAIMENPIIGYTCAVSRDLKYLLGKRVYIEGLGVYRVNDLMDKRYTKRVDLCMNKESAVKFGIQQHDIVIIDR